MGRASWSRVGDACTGGERDGVPRKRLTPMQRLRQLEPSWLRNGQTTSLLASVMEKDDVRDERGGILTPPCEAARRRRQDENRGAKADRRGRCYQLRRQKLNRALAFQGDAGDESEARRGVRALVGAAAGMEAGDRARPSSEKKRRWQVYER